jgi:hypothetical protein
MTIDSRDDPEIQGGEGHDVPAQKTGYKKPPVHGQVRPGEVRNPYGRRGKRGRRPDSGGGLALQIMRELDMVVPVKVGGKVKKLPVSSIIARRLREDLMGSPKDRHQAMMTLHKFKMFDGFADFQNWRAEQDQQYDHDLDEALAEAELIQNEFEDEDRAYEDAVAACSCASMAPYQSAVQTQRTDQAPGEPASIPPGMHGNPLPGPDRIDVGPEARASSGREQPSGDDFYDGMVDS